MNSELLTAGRLTFEVRRSNRRRTLEISVGRQGELCVFAPIAASMEEISAWVERKLLWVHRKLSLKQEKSLNRSRPEFVTGESFSYLGRTYKLRLIDQKSEALRFDGNTFLLRRDVRHNAEKYFQAWYRFNGLSWVEGRVREYARRVYASPTKVAVRELAYRWGSCTSRRIITFHWKLFQLPARLVDYVIVHELVHLVEPHHGPKFWACLERALPDWRERKEQLAQWAPEYLRFRE